MDDIIAALYWSIETWMMSKTLKNLGYFIKQIEKKLKNRYVYIHASAVVRTRSVVLGGRLPGHHMVDHELAHENQWTYKQGNSTKIEKMIEYWRRALVN